MANQFLIKEEGITDLINLLKSLTSTLVSVDEKYMTLAHVADTKAYRQHEETEFTINGLKSKSQAWLSSLEFLLTTKPAPVFNDESEFKENYIRAGKIWGHTEHLYAMAFGKLITIMSPEENHKALTEIVEYNESTLSKQVNQLG